MLKIYLASPYSNKSFYLTHQYYKRAVKQVAILILEGHIVFSPIVHFHVVALEHNLPTTFDYWRRVNFSFLEWCEQLNVLQLEGWKTSKGVQWEIEQTTLLGKEIYYLPEKV